jgi:chromosome partitioning protein
MPILVMLNQKGGVGKTSTCHHLAGTLALMGRKVLLMDNDPQASLTQGFWGPERTRQQEGSETIAALYREDGLAIPEAIIRPTGVAGIDLVPGSPELDYFNMIPEDRWSPSEAGMRDFLREVAGRYDVAMIDCPPNLHLCSWSALVAADYLVVPLQAEDYGAQGLTPVRAAARAARAGPNPSLAMGGYLITMFDKRLGIHLAYEEQLRELYGPEVFTATVPLAKDFKEAVAARLPISHYKPKSAAAKATRAVADELLERLERAITEADARRVA